jgi:AGZA family xanthine/uracil permease-like MFS transporter
MGVPWPVALGCVFLSGVAFLILTLTGVRQLIVAAIPPHLFAAVAGGIGLFIGFIGLKNAGIIVANPATFVALGDLHAPDAALALFGLVVIGALSVWNVRGAMLIGIVLTTLAAALAGRIDVKPVDYDLSALGATAFKLDLAGVFGLGGKHGLGLLEVLFVFLFVDLFDNLGTLVAVTKRAGLIDAAGRIPGLNRMLLTDAAATMVGSLAGTSTVTSYVESAAGVQAGGRTGLTAVVTGLLFLATMFVAPYAQLAPVAATAPALIIVGGLMLLPLTEIAWEDPLAAIPAFLTVAMIPLTFSIANGLAFGLTAHAVLKLVRGQLGRKDWLLLVLAGLFIFRFLWLSGAG